jgi:hypothetical protein
MAAEKVLLTIKDIASVHRQIALYRSRSVLRAAA